MRGVVLLKILSKIKIMYHHWMVVLLENNIDESTIPHLCALVRANDSWGMLELGYRYHMGNGVQKNIEKAYELYLRAADGEGSNEVLSYATTNIGRFYLDGIYVVKDLVKATEWFKKAALNGHALAQYNYGISFIEGWAGTIDKKSGIHWLAKSESSGFSKASEYLEQMIEQ